MLQVRTFSVKLNTCDSKYCHLKHMNPGYEMRPELQRMKIWGRTKMNIAREVQIKLS